MDTILQMKMFKCFNVYLNPIIIGGLLSSLGSWDFNNDKFIWVKIISVIILFSWYVFTSFRYYKMEESINLKIDQLNDNVKSLKEEIKISNTKNNTCCKVLLSLTSLFNTCAESINDISNSLLKKQAKLDNWNYKTVCTGICNGIYETLCLCSNGCSDFSVSIMLYDTNSSKKSKSIRMIAQKGKYEGHPDIFDEPLYLSRDKNFYAVKMFNKKHPEISILTTSEDINKNFVFSDNGKDHPKYSQYVGVPIQCSGKQMISLLQICAFDNSKIADTKEEIMEIVNNCILPFSYFALLNNKIEKGFINSISMIEKED